MNGFMVVLKDHFLPEGMINKENVSAEMNNGELIVKLQKLAETQKDTRKINIK